MRWPYLLWREVGMTFGMVDELTGKKGLIYTSLFTYSNSVYNNRYSRTYIKILVLNWKIIINRDCMSTTPVRCLYILPGADGLWTRYTVLTTTVCVVLMFFQFTNVLHRKTFLVLFAGFDQTFTNLSFLSFDRTPKITPIPIPVYPQSLRVHIT